MRDDRDLRDMMDEARQQPVQPTGYSAPAPASAAMPQQRSIEQMYSDILGRQSDAGGAAYWQGKFGNEIDDAELAQFRAAAAPEIGSHIGQNYKDLFGRDSETAGREYWQNQLNTGALGSVSALQEAMKRGAQGYDITANADNASYPTSWRQGLDPDRDRLMYDTATHKWNPVSQGNNGGNFTGTGDNNGGTITNLHTAVPDHTGVQYGPGVATGSPSLGAPSGWGWNPSENLWMGSRTGTVNGPVPYKTTDSSGNVIRSWGLAAHPWDAPAPMNQGAGIPNAQGTAPAFGSPTRPVGGGFSLPNWTGQQQQTRQFAEGGSVRGALEQLLRGK